MSVAKETSFLNAFRSDVRASADKIAMRLQQTLATDAKRIHEIMCISAVIIFPLFAIFDLSTMPKDVYWEVTTIRFSITIIVAVWLFIQRKKNTPEIYLSYFTFFALSWFCCYACVLGGKVFLFQHNIAYCTVFLAGSLFLLWHWKHSLIVTLTSIAVYSLFVHYSDTITFQQVMLDGGSVLLTIMLLHPVIVAYRFNAYKNQFLLKLALEESNELLKAKNNSVQEQNSELTKAKEKLKSVNQHLEYLVTSRTHSLENTNKELMSAIGELDQFLYASHHDLKGPIARLKGLVQVARRDVDDKKTHEYLDVFWTNLMDMEYLVEKFNKINNFYHHETKKEEIPLKEFFEELLVPYQKELSSMQLDLKFNGISTITADPELLRPALHHLIENAILFRKESGAHLRISVTEGNHITFIRVHDNGAGIPMNVLPNIFKMFYRGNEHSKGHGLGLYLAKKAVEKMKGVMEVKSIEGEFTEFTIRF